MPSCVNKEYKCVCLPIWMELETKDVEKEIERSEIVKKKGYEIHEGLTIKWEDGKEKFISKKKQRKGKKAKSSGASFELKVRKDLEKKSWIVDKWSNNVDLEIGGVVAAKRKFNPFSRVMAIGTGFPDFICFQLMDDSKKRYKLIGVEVKTNGILSKIEKQKCVFLLNNKIFSEILIAKKGAKQGRRVPIEYDDFKERYKKLF